MKDAASKEQGPSKGPAPNSWPRRSKKLVRRALMAIAVTLVPRFYMAYMWFVMATSEVIELGPRPDIARARYGKGIYAVWHDEVVFVAWSFGKYGPSTLASRGDSGEVVARMLQLCNFKVFRGGSSAGRKRRSRQIVQDMVNHMNEHEGVLYGITTDGSSGPVYRMKPGAVHIASRCRAPLLVEKTWCRRYLRLPTWDRSLVPLPFNRIVHLYAGPFIPPTDSTDQDAIARCLELLEQELDLLAADARQRAGDPADEAWLALFPERLRDAMRRAAPRPLDRHMEQLDALEELLGKPLPRDAQRLAEVDQKA